jgi:hypothetical protein
MSQTPVIKLYVVPRGGREITVEVIGHTHDSLAALLQNTGGEGTISVSTNAGDTYVFNVENICYFEIWQVRTTTT